MERVPAPLYTNLHTTVTLLKTCRAQFTLPFRGPFSNFVLLTKKRNVACSNNGTEEQKNHLVWI